MNENKPFMGKWDFALTLFAATYGGKGDAANKVCDIHVLEGYSTHELL